MSLWNNFYLRKLASVFCLLVLSSFYACDNSNIPSNIGNGGIPQLAFQVVKKYQHDTSAFTQGFFFEDNVLYESTGLLGKSHFQRYEGLFTDHVNVKILQSIDKNYFGEGTVILNQHLYWLTWQNKKTFVYTIPSYQLTKIFDEPYEGWGITHDAMHLIVSDGTATLRWLDAKTFQTICQKEVRDDLGPVNQINEIEMIDGKLYANRWETNTILVIDTATARVIATMDLSFLEQEARQAYAKSDVLNGIAYNPLTQQLLLTGKHWPFIYEIKIKR